MSENYYEILGISRNASDKEIRQAYRRLARKYHPDVNSGDKHAEATFKKLNEAQEVLSDPQKRQHYDRFGENWRNAAHSPHGNRKSRGSNFTRSTKEDFLSGINSQHLGDIFGDFLGNQGIRRNVTTTSKKMRSEKYVGVTLEEAFSGTTRVIQVNNNSQEGARKFEVKIPAGVDNGSRIRVRPRKAGNGEDLYLVISVQPHTRFERRGTDLYSKVDVPLVDAVLGGEVEVSTLTDKVLLKIPPETQNGRSFRISGKGMPHLQSPDSRGSMYVTTQLNIPPNISEREKELFREIRVIREGKE